VFATEELIEAMDDAVFEQAANVATLPGIVGYSYCMPDGHRGYGFPIGGLAAFDPEVGVISPGGIGFDINCGMRLVRTNLTEDEVRPRLEELIDRLYSGIPAGVGGSGMISLGDSEFRELAERGLEWALDRGFATEDDLDHTEEGGRMDGADSELVSAKAVQRGRSANHTMHGGMNVFDRIGLLSLGSAYTSCANEFLVRYTTARSLSSSLCRRQRLILNHGDHVYIAVSRPIRRKHHVRTVGGDPRVGVRLLDPHRRVMTTEHAGLRVPIAFLLPDPDDA
jgi:hypothetical protein